jgi:hypothetical protein
MRGDDERAKQRSVTANSSGCSFLAGYEPAPPRFIARQPHFPWLVVGTACKAGLTGQLDASIVQLILPTLEHDFAARLSAVSWVCRRLPARQRVEPAGDCPARGDHRVQADVPRRVHNIHARFRIVWAGSRSDPLIAYRTLQGIGGAMLAPNSLVILIKATGPSRQGRAIIGVFAAIQAVGVTAGPAVGGLLLAAFSWGRIFWVNVPIAFAAAVVGWFVIP